MPAPQAPAQPPPFRLVGEHFLAALLWLLVGTGGLATVAPGLAAGDLFAPRVIGVTHAVTLGALTTMIFGALYQFFPNALGVGARSIPVAHRTFWTLQAGVAVLVAGFWWWRPALLLTGWGLLFLAVGGMAWNLLPQRRRATQGRAVGLYVSAGHSALGLAMVLGLARIGEPLGWWSVSRTGLVAAHYHLAALGFVTLTIVGVGSRMVPMFLFAQAAPQWPVRLIGPLAAAGLLAQAVGLVWSLALPTVAGGLLAAAAGVLVVLQLGLWLGHRAQRRLDVSGAHLAVATLFLASAIVLGLAMLLGGTGFNPRAWAAYGLVGILGWMTLFTIGIAYRIAPFLSWLHLFGGMGRGTHAPPAHALLHRGLAWASLAAFSAGVATAATAILAGSGSLARAGAALIATGGLGVCGQLVRGLHLWRATPRDPLPTRAPIRPGGRTLQVLR